MCSFSVTSRRFAVTSRRRTLRVAIRGSDSMVRTAGRVGVRGGTWVRGVLGKSCTDTCTGTCTVTYPINYDNLVQVLSVFVVIFCRSVPVCALAGFFRPVRSLFFVFVASRANAAAMAVVCGFARACAAFSQCVSAGV